MASRNVPLWYYPYLLVEFAFESLLQKWANLWRYKRHIRKRITEYNIHGKVVVITGANAGLGKCTAKEMARRGAVVVMGCRNLRKGEEACKEIMKETGSSSVELYHLDLSDLASVRSFAAEVFERFPVIDILINNAGISPHSKQQQLTKEGWDLTMTTNHLGPFLLTNLLIKSIQQSSIARVVTLSSTMSTFATLDTDDLFMKNEVTTGVWGERPYCNSKLANALFAKSLAKRYPSVKAYSLCPGIVKTRLSYSLQNNSGLVTKLCVQIGVVLLGFDVEDGIATILHCALKKDIERDSGKFFRFKNPLSSANNMLDDTLADKLWMVSEKYVS